MADTVKVKAVGLATFRRDVRRADKEIGLQLQRDLREVAARVAAEAAGEAPGRVGQSFRPFQRGIKGGVRSTFLPARFLEFGFHPRGGPTFVEGRNYIGRAMERQEEAIVDGIADAVDRAATRLGWH